MSSRMRQNYPRLMFIVGIALIAGSIVMLSAPGPTLVFALPGLALVALALLTGRRGGKSPQAKGSV
jgi:uncharacterized membrane protein YjjP (DUF1212 family)